MVPPAPILFFGDLEMYRTSRVRVLTVGKNPSLHEFSAGQPLQRFPLAEGSLDRELPRYLDAMSAYFQTDPYHPWFSAFEPLLNGLGASYYEGASSTALHTDICSPVATNPTWNKLDEADQATLKEDGVPLWNQWVTILKPQMVLLSFKEECLSLIDGRALDDWRTIHEFEFRKDGKPRKDRYLVRTRWYDVNGERSLFVFGRGNQKPFMLTGPQKREMDTVVLNVYKAGR